MSNWGIEGKKIREVTADDTFITFRFDDETTQSYRVVGDCCSESWIEHLEMPGDVCGSTILRVEEDPMEDQGRTLPEDEEDRFAYLKVYKTRFVTDRGEIVVEYRNESNGYYGGWLDPV